MESLNFFAQQNIEVCLLTPRPVNVFQMPPMSSAKGHCSQDWHGKQIWTGHCRIMLVNSVVCRV